MAHKHNRRRIRPRGRVPHSLQITLDPPKSDTPSLESHFLASGPSVSDPARPSHPPLLRSHPANLVSRHWQNRYLAWRNRDLAQKREAAQLEAEQIKLFGGEPGDDVALCYKMLEVFEGMDWIDSLE